MWEVRFSGPLKARAVTLKMCTGVFFDMSVSVRWRKLGFSYIVWYGGLCFDYHTANRSGFELWPRAGGLPLLALRSGVRTDLSLV